MVVISFNQKLKRRNLENLISRIPEDYFPDFNNPEVTFIESLDDLTPSCFKEVLTSLGSADCLRYFTPLEQNLQEQALSGKE